MTTMKKTVHLNPGESKVVSFEFTPTQAKVYQVTVNGLSGSFVAVEPAAAEFVYTSDLIVEVIDYPTPHDIQWTLGIKNVGEGPGVLHLELFLRMESPYEPGEFAAWKRVYSKNHTLAAGESRTLTGQLGASPYSYELKAESEAGTLVTYFRA